MEAISKNRTIDTYSEKKQELPLISKNSKNSHSRFLTPLSKKNFYQSNKKNSCMEIFTELDLIFQTVIKKEFSFAYDYIMAHLPKDLSEGKKLLGNRYNLCAVLYFILARKKGYLVKKSSLCKILAIEKSSFNAVFRILIKMPYFNDIVEIARKKKKLGELKEISISGTPINKNKNHKKMKTESSKADCPDLELFAQFITGVP